MYYYKIIFNFNSIKYYNIIIKKLTKYNNFIL